MEECFYCTKCKKDLNKNMFAKKQLEAKLKTCRNCRNEYMREYRKKDSAKIYRKQYRDKNRDIEKMNWKRHVENNKEKVINYMREYRKRNYERDIKNRMEKDPNFKLARTLRTRLLKAIGSNQKNGSAVKDLGCSIDFLKEYFENKFQEGMSWENHGEWHIDHIKPLASFDLTNREQFLEACNYTNLQPLWAKDNLSKSSKKR